MKLLDGTSLSSEIEKEVKTAIEALTGRKPGLAFVLVGSHPASQTYIRMKKKRCAQVGIRSFDLELPEKISEEMLLSEIARLNQDEDVDGILVQLPLPPHLLSSKVMEAVCPEKDVDGFHPLNVGKLLLGETTGFFPCTPYGIVTLLSRHHIDISSKHVVIVGRSNIVGKPLAALLMQKSPHGNATVTVAHSRSRDLEALCRSADILVAATGHPQTIRSSMVKEGAVVVDVGINRGLEGIVGDVAFDEVAPLCSYITPVPGGVGPMTIAMLLSNTLLSYKRRQRTL
jgi:methylenetetrahydrofolate dehydrogenase (NADP+) / methenyltetrahydrofolate cyclohydrolase